MSVKVSSWVWQHSRARGPELLVLLAIADQADDQGTNAYPSVATLAAKVRMSKRTVQRHVVSLVDLGELVVTSPGGGRISNSYSVIMGGDNLSPVAEIDAGALSKLCHGRGVTGDMAATSLLTHKTSSNRPTTSKNRPRRDGSEWEGQSTGAIAL